MKLKMTIDEALEFADSWSRGMTIHEGSQGWRVVCMLLANEVRTMQAKLEAAEKDAPDAQRYRWVLSKAAITDFIFKFIDSNERHLSGAIDAALAQNGKE